jgi:hypothetical protein
MRLNNQEIAQLRDAILDAYPDIAGFQSLSMAMSQVDISTANYGTLFGGTVKYVVHQLVEQENAKGRIATVIGAARRGNAGHAGLAKLQEKWLRTTAAGDKARLEAMIFQELNYRPADAWSSQLQAAHRWVCRVERVSDGQSVGSGFLVGDDLVLTNYHVLYGTQSPGTVEAEPVKFRFDAVGGAAGRLATTVPGDWIVARSPPGDDEWGAGSGEPTPQQLDFALLRTAEQVGADSNGGAARGFARIVGSAAGGAARMPVVVLQHPQQADLQICLGSFDGPNPTGTRLHHTATTQRGSSGSLCLSMELKAVGLHNGGLGGQHNTAVPLDRIAAFVNQSGILIG